MTIVTLGIDLAKNVFAVHGVENRLSVNVSAPRMISSGQVRGLISTHQGPFAMT
ncbi:hypothetical protein [Paraburkholderia hospita]|uniref:hypothetical protein n=1 Tax=Paraburkholderia hospita TaxID=169430 RepID=UPI00131A232F|nr:hypothetical protein [Paraburkholderia hospita]